MDKQKALLVVTGGRAVPNVLSLLWLQPRVVRVLLSEQGWDYTEAFQGIATSLPECQIDILPNVDAYDFEACLHACLSACEPYPGDEWEWTFDITSAPKITGIAAYEIARQKGISCWHADALRDRHVSLVKPVHVDTARFFRLTLEDYMKAQHRVWVRKGKTTYRETVRQWADVARAFAHSADAIKLLKGLRDKRPCDVLTFSAQEAGSPCLQLAIDLGLLAVERSSAGALTARFTSVEAAGFLGTGDWLEFYVWHEAISRGLADEDHCQWGYKILDGSVEKEFDLALMYKAQLMVAECKTDEKPFISEKEYLHKLHAKANVLGGSYVCKLFIAAQRSGGGSYEAFHNQAGQYKIVVVTGEHLPEIGQILEKEATRPTYPRI
jgi:hypothetical protein